MVVLHGRNCSLRVHSCKSKGLKPQTEMEETMKVNSVRFDVNAFDVP